MNFSTNRRVAIMDTECYPNYWSIGFKATDSGRVVVLERTNDMALDRVKLRKLLETFQIISFNGINYDIPMITLAMTGATCAQLKKASDMIIQSRLQPWQFYDHFGLARLSYVDHIDLFDVSPGAPTKPSLKLYAGRLYSRKMQDLPFEHDMVLTDEQLDVLRSYHGNDLDVTHDMYNELQAQLKLRVFMSNQYGIDLRSKSDAQIAEAVIKSEVERITGEKVYKPEIRKGFFRYTAPSFIRYRTQQMRDVLKIVTDAKFVVSDNGVVLMPDEIRALDVKIGSSVYNIGLGGLHSNESSTAHKSDDDYVLIDRDAASFYPNIILRAGMYPSSMGPAFLQVYRSIVARRLACKRAGKADDAESLKIVVNGGFGKTGSPYSVLYAPKMMIHTTVTGQLALLMLIEAVELCGFQVVSANTDGFVTKVKRSEIDTFEALVWDWETSTGFETEETRYRSLHSRDVNNYCGITEDGKVKLKGAYAPAGRGLKGAAGLKKNPQMEVAIDAAVRYLRDGTPVEDTIHDCRDVRKFIVIRTVKGGAMKDGELVGKAIRWYYSTQTTTGIHYRGSGTAVPKSIGAMPLMELSDELPADIDYAYYIREAYAILQDVGAKVVDPALRGRKGSTIARLPDQKTLHILDLASGVTLCGRRSDSIRDAWVEYKAVPDGRRLCAKCKAAEV